MDGGLLPKGEYPLPRSSKGGNIYLLQACRALEREKEESGKNLPTMPQQKQTCIRDIQQNFPGSRPHPLGPAKTNWKKGFLNGVPQNVQMLNSGHIYLFTFCSVCFKILRDKKEEKKKPLKRLIWE